MLESNRLIVKSSSEYYYRRNCLKIIRYRSFVFRYTRIILIKSTKILKNCNIRFALIILKDPYDTCISERSSLRLESIRLLPFETSTFDAKHNFEYFAVFALVAHSRITRSHSFIDLRTSRQS